MKVLGIITARGGSKSVPGKNLKLLAGRPLLAYTVDAARNCAALDRVILSTEDESIAAAGRSMGCEVPFIRPSELSRDDTPHLPVIEHAAAWMRDHAHYAFDAVMIYNFTQGSAGAYPAVSIHTFGSQTITAGTFTLTMPTNNTANALIRLSTT